MGPGFGGRGRRGPRARRGDVRAAILRLLTEEPRTGYALMQAIEERSNGVWTPSAGSIYPALSLLEDEGLVRSVGRDGKKTFELTEDGTQTAEQRSGEPAPWDTVRGEVNEDALALMQATKQLGMAVLQIGQAGTPEQAREAKDILDAARKQLFGLLAKD
jgi:DNA-binding PadR family transcriptional regulator